MSFCDQYFGISYNHTSEYVIEINQIVWNINFDLLFFLLIPVNNTFQYIIRYTFWTPTQTYTHFTQYNLTKN